MAPLNPTIQPTNDPNFRGYSEAIKVPDTIKPQGVQQNQIMPRGQEIGDRSAEYEGKAAAYSMSADSIDQQAYGDLFKNITQMGDFLGKGGVAVTKKNIEDKVYEIADRERQTYTETLEKIKQGGGVNNILAPSSEDGRTTPDEVAGLDETLTTLKTAKDNGKITSSYYQGRLLSEAKRLRAENPGFKQEIDDAFAKVTGSNPANAYLRAITADLNRASSSVASEQKKAESFLLSGNRPGYPNAASAMDNVRSGRWGLREVMDFTAPYEQEDFQLSRRAKIFNDITATAAHKKVKVGELVDYAGGVAVNRVVDGLAGQMGITSAENASKMETAVKAGVIPQQQWIQWGQNIAQQKTELSLRMHKDAHLSGAVKALGQTEINKRIEDSLKPLDILAERIYAKDVGGFHRLSQDLKAINDETQKGLLEHPKLGPFLRVTAALKDIGGESNVTRLSGEVIKGDFNADMKTYFTKFQTNMATQYNMRTTGIPLTFNDAVDDLKKKGIKDTRLNNSVLDLVKEIHNPNSTEEMKMNYAAAAFSPENRGMISKLSADGVDAQGRRVTGQSAVFQKFTSAEMTKSMWALGQKDPQVWKNYVDWAQETLSNELINKEINGLAEIRNPTIRVGWDSDNKRFVPSANVQAAVRYKAGGGNVINPAHDPELLQVNMMVERMNGNLRTYKNIAEAANINTEDFILKTIANTNPEALRRTDSIPYHILRDIGLAKIKGGVGSK